MKCIQDFGGKAAAKSEKEVDCDDWFLEYLRTLF
jgi:hypothetical protein